MDEQSKKEEAAQRIAGDLPEKIRSHPQPSRWLADNPGPEFVLFDLAATPATMPGWSGQGRGGRGGQSDLALSALPDGSAIYSAATAARARTNVKTWTTRSGHQHTVDRSLFRDPDHAITAMTVAEIELGHEAHVSHFGAGDCASTTA